jgi:hypothetical protein
MLFVNGDDDTITCALSRGCCKVNGIAVSRPVCGGLPYHKYDFLNIVNTNIPFFEILFLLL